MIGFEPSDIAMPERHRACGAREAAAAAALTVFCCLIALTHLPDGAPSLLQEIKLPDGTKTAKGCAPSRTKLLRCNPPYPCGGSLNETMAAFCSSPLAEEDTAHSPSGTLHFCSYASARTDADVDAPCKLNGVRPPPAGQGAPSPELRVYEDEGFNCFDSMRDPADRLCVPRQYITSVDCGLSDATLRALLSTGERDFARMRGGARPQFQCFHRGGFGSVGWLHVHSFVHQADSICPTMTTPYGEAPNPLPQRMVCADGWRDLDARFAQMRRVLDLVHFAGHKSKSWNQP